MRMYDIILKKRDGGTLTPEEIAFFVRGYTDGSIPDYQASALTMAIFYKGMTEEETVLLTKEMAQSGDQIDLSRFGELTVDKHSTGGVGDKTTLIVAPTVASLGGKLAKMSGRGLGHTGGTVDKLESIDGYNTTLEAEEFFAQVEKVGISVIGQSGNLTPADKKLYALRDVTATVDSIPLITSSIMSKKIAAGSKNIVLDVKCGSGAFMKTLADAQCLAENMVKIGKGCGRNIAAVITDMDVPLGENVGNALEVIEAIDVLKGNKKGDLYEVCVALATQMISLTLKIAEDKAKEMVIGAIEDGSAFAKMKEWIAAQGGNAQMLEDISLFKKAEIIYEVKSEQSGFISSMDAAEIGSAACTLGAGRASKDDVIDFAAGIVIKKKVGEEVKSGDVLALLYTNKQDAVEPAAKRYLDAIKISKEKTERNPLIYKIIR